MADETCPRCIDEGETPRRIGARGMCSKHYLRAYRAGEFTPRDRPGPVPSGRTCETDGCDRPHKGYGYCRKHLYEAQRNGLVDGVARCAVDGCDKLAVAHDLCLTHRRHQLKGKPLVPLRAYRKRDGVCPGPECDQAIHSGGYCAGHYWQAREGRELTPIDRTPNVPKGTPCWVGDCGRPSLTMDGICRTHYRYRADGDADWQRPVPDRAADGEGHLNEYGYRILCIDGRLIGEHRVVMERLLGRPLLPTETVHHKTGGFKGRSNNDPSNLELWTGNHPAGHRVEDVVAYCREMLGVYGDPGELARYAAEGAALLGEGSARH